MSRTRICRAPRTSHAWITRALIVQVTEETRLSFGTLATVRADEVHACTTVLTRRRWTVVVVDLID